MLQEHRLNRGKIAEFGPPLQGNWVTLWGHGYGSEENAGGVCISIKEKWKNHIVHSANLIQARAQFVVLEEKGIQWGLLNIYAPNQVVERKQFWKYIWEHIPSSVKEWIVGGDFNMVEDPNDRRGGKLVIIPGPELAEWEKFIFQMNLTDAWHLRNFSRERLSLRFSRSSLLSQRSLATTTAEEASSSASRAGSTSIAVVES